MPAIAQARPKVTIANAAGNINLVMQELMKQQKFLEGMGLEPNVMNVADGAKMMGGILGGDIDCSTMAGFGQVFPAIERGGKLKVLAGAALLPTLTVFTSKSDVKTLKDLEGRTFGTGSVGALLHQLAVAILRKKGVDVSKVRFVNIGSSADVFRGVIVGTLDAGFGETGIIETADRFKVRPIEGGNLSTELTEYTFQGAWASDKAIETKRETLVRTLAAYAKMYRFVHKPEAKDAFMKAYAGALKSGTQEDADSMWTFVQRYKPYAEDLALTPERLRYMQQLNVDTDVQKTVLPFERVGDMSLAAEALKLL
jgi:ABC-type nitrate/sulfonate/bicarbonate transport system substrate-binding protein